MKKIGILYGMEQTFPFALLDKINSMDKGISAELMNVGTVGLNSDFDYDVILDRASHEVFFYRTILKKALSDGVYVVNNPLKFCSYDNFYNLMIGVKSGINVPKTAVIPTKEHPPGTSSESMRNLMYPLNWEDVFAYIGFPAYIKPNIGLAGNSAYKVYNPQEFFSAYDFTGSKIMLLQESIDYSAFYRVYIIGGSYVKIVGYDPVKPHHLRYSKEPVKINAKLKSKIKADALKISNEFGFDFNAVDFAVKDEIPYAIDLFNPIPRIEKAFLAQQDFDDLVDATADFLCKIALGNTNTEKNTQETKSKKVTERKSAKKTSLK